MFVYLRFATCSDGHLVDRRHSSHNFLHSPSNSVAGSSHQGETHSKTRRTFVTNLSKGQMGCTWRRTLPRQNQSNYYKFIINHCFHLCRLVAPGISFQSYIYTTHKRIDSFQENTNKANDNKLNKDLEIGRGVMASSIASAVELVEKGDIFELLTLTESFISWISSNYLDRLHLVRTLDDVIGRDHHQLPLAAEEETDTSRLCFFDDRRENSVSFHGLRVRILKEQLIDVSL